MMRGLFNKGKGKRTLWAAAAISGLLPLSLGSSSAWGTHDSSPNKFDAVLGESTGLEGRAPVQGGLCTDFPLGDPRRFTGEVNYSYPLLAQQATVMQVQYAGNTLRGPATINWTASGVWDGPFATTPPAGGTGTTCAGKFGWQYRVTTASLVGLGFNCTTGLVTDTASNGPPPNPTTGYTGLKGSYYARPEVTAGGYEVVRLEWTGCLFNGVSVGGPVWVTLTDRAHAVSVDAAPTDSNGPTHLVSNYVID